MPYANASTQTIWAGLTKMESVRPDILFTAPDTTTPPAEMITEKSQGLDDNLAAAQPGNVNPNSTAFRSLLERRPNRPNLPTRISLPKADGFDDEVIPSPPPTHALLSPLPEANKRYAGHTPLIPRALSPVQDDEQSAQDAPAEEEGSTTPKHDQPLIGPLMLPTNPVDGASDQIALDVLDDVLEKVAKDQERFSRLKEAPEPATIDGADDDLSLSRKASSDSRKSSTVEVVDGVRLKSPRLNFGAPIGQV
jgi:hypothetical protein